MVLFSDPSVFADVRAVQWELETIYPGLGEWVHYAIIDVPCLESKSFALMDSSLRELLDEVMVVADKTQQLTARNYSCITTNTWTSEANHNYIAVTAHFIDAEFFPFAERHTADNLAEELKRVAREWSLDKMIVTAVSDKAANIVTAIKLVGWKRYQCFAHNFTLVVQHGLREINDVLKRVLKNCRIP
ncbi:hypothetical protein J437_LFUL015861 [Ladona fulva]|uniref:Uncharacterized protein n=1 Tax=Ladona fulva TaxID=123851 RepID=A0A8K0KHY6_LADFU|nr:hypothetical protein J437_LFUL015861 [Ladona fulva]